MSKAYVYDDGQYLAVVRRISGSTLGISIPQEVRRAKGIYPGTRLIVHVDKAKPIPEKKEQTEEDAKDGE